MSNIYYIESLKRGNLYDALYIIVFYLIIKEYYDTSFLMFDYYFQGEYSQNPKSKVPQC